MSKYKFSAEKLRGLSDDALLEVYRQTDLEVKRLDGMRAAKRLVALRGVGKGGVDLSPARRFRELRKNRARCLMVLGERGLVV